MLSLSLSVFLIVKLYLCEIFHLQILQTSPLPTFSLPSTRQQQCAGPWRFGGWAVWRPARRGWWSPGLTSTPWKEEENYWRREEIVVRTQLTVIICNIVIFSGGEYEALIPVFDNQNVKRVWWQTVLSSSVIQLSGSRSYEWLSSQFWFNQESLIYIFYLFHPQLNSTMSTGTVTWAGYLFFGLFNSCSKYIYQCLVCQFMWPHGRHIPPTVRARGRPGWWGEQTGVLTEGSLLWSSVTEWSTLHSSTLIGRGCAQIGWDHDVCCLSLVLYGIRELVSATPRTWSRTLSGPVW